MLCYIPDFDGEYEKQFGEKPSAAVLRFVEQLNKVGQIFEERGRNDAANGLLIPSEDAFLAWGEKTFGDDREMGEAVSEMMRHCYIDGYREGESQNENHHCVSC